MTNEQLYLAIGLPIVFNAALTAALLTYMNVRFNAVNERFSAIDKRFDDMRDLWRAELRRVEDVLDARLKHMEDQR